MNQAIVLQSQRIQPPETWLASISKPYGPRGSNVYQGQLGWSWCATQEEGVSLLVFGLSNIWPAVGFCVRRCRSESSTRSAEAAKTEGGRCHLSYAQLIFESSRFSPHLCVWVSRQGLGQQRQGNVVLGIWEYSPSPVPPESGFRLWQCQFLGPC